MLQVLQLHRFCVAATAVPPTGELVFGGKPPLAGFNRCTWCISVKLLANLAS